MSSAYPRLAIAAVTIAVAAALAVYPMFEAGKLGRLIAPLGAAALLSLLLPLLWRGRGTWVTLFLLGAEYVTAESFADVGTLSIVAYAAGLIGLCELLFWLAELPSASVDAIAVGRRLLALALAGVAASALALVTLSADSVRISSALGALVLGALAAAVLLLMPLLLVRQRDRRD
jgi:hypothetical protein